MYEPKCECSGALLAVDALTCAREAVSCTSEQMLATAAQGLQRSATRSKDAHRTLETVR